MSQSDWIHQSEMSDDRRTQTSTSSSHEASPIVSDPCSQSCSTKDGAASSGPSASGNSGRSNQQVLRDFAGDHSSGTNDGPNSNVVHDALSSSGQPLDTEVREGMETVFGRDLGSIRIHTGPTAAESARSLDANAYTVGQDIVFSQGAYNPETAEGQRTLTHELTHTIQQGSVMQQLPNNLDVVPQSDPLEREARAVAGGELDPRNAGKSGGAPISISRDPTPPVSPPATGSGAPAAPAAPAKKTVTVNITNMFGGTRKGDDDIKVANTIYSAANIEIKKGTEVTIDETKTKTILGADLSLDEYTDPAKPTTEEKAMFKENQSKDAITVYFVKKHTFSNGEAFWPSGGSGLIGCSVVNATVDNSFAHELGHVLLDDGTHSVPDKTYLMYKYDDTARKKLTPDQITKARSSKFAK
jgi:hypothetical protein